MWRVAHRVVHRHQLDAGVGAAGEQRPGERAADPPESVDPYTNRHWCPSRSTGSCRLQQSRQRLSPTVRIVGEAVGPAHIGAPTGSTPSAAMPVVVDGEARRRRRSRKRVDPAAVVEDGAQVVGRRRARRSPGPAGGGSPPAPPGPASPRRASRSSGDAQHRQHARVERAGREHDLVGGGDRGDRVGRRRRVGGHELDPADRPALFATATWPSISRRPLDVGLQHDRLGRRRQHPARRRRSEPAGLVERGGEVAERLGEPDEHEVAERVAVELAVARSGARTRPATRRSSSASATRHRRRSPGAGRRGRGGAAPTSRRRRRRSRPR